MSRFLARIRGLFKSRTQVGIDKAGNQYFIRNEEVDGIMKERRWVIFRGEEEDPTSLPVEWICWLNGQRKKPPTPEEMMELEARRERVKLNIAKLQKEEEEEEEEKLKKGVPQPSKTGKVGPPDLESFIKQLRGASLDPGSEGEVPDLESDSKEKWTRKFRDSDSTNTKTPAPKAPRVPMSTEPTGSGESFKPGTWQPPS